MVRNSFANYWRCLQVLAKEKGNAKALFRRGRAHNALGHTEEALQDLTAAAQAAPDDRAISREIQVRTCMAL